MIKEIEKAFKKEFPKGWITFRSGILGSETVYVDFGVVPKELVENGIKNNDPMWSMFSFEPKSLFVEYHNGGLSVKPVKNKYLYCETVKCRFSKGRKKSPEALVTFLSKYFKKCRALVDAEKENIIGFEKYPAGTFEK